MDARYVNVFLEALVSVLQGFGITDIKKGGLVKREIMSTNMDITSVTGLVGAVQGNVAYSFSRDTARMIVSRMMLGTPVAEINEYARNAIGEMANLITETASSALSKMVSDRGGRVDATTSSVIIGKDVFFIMSSVPSIAIAMDTQVGRIEVNIGLED